MAERIEDQGDADDRKYMIPDSRWTYSYFTHNDHPPENADGEAFIACHECHSVDGNDNQTTNSVEASETIMRGMEICQACHIDGEASHPGKAVFGVGGIG